MSRIQARQVADTVLPRAVHCASVANIAGSYTATGGAAGRGSFTGMPDAVDGVSLSTDSRVLLWKQSTGAQNGIFKVTTVGTGSNGEWERASDCDSDDEIRKGMLVYVAAGTVNARKILELDVALPALNCGGASGSILTFRHKIGAPSNWLSWSAI